MARVRQLVLLGLLLVSALGTTWPSPGQAASADRIDSPTEGSTVSGMVEVRGTALSDGPNFRSYHLEVGPGREPSAWQPIGPERDHTVENGVLGLWDTSALAPGEYSLRLTVFSESGGETQSWVRVTVAPASGGSALAPSPRATPRPTPAASPSPTATAAPTPEPTLTPTVQPTATLEPSPTAAAAPEAAPAPAAPPLPGGPLRCPMLYYHEVPGQAGLAAQVAALLQAGYRLVTMGQLVDALEGWAEPPPGCLVLTFDDGLASQISGALPVLLRFSVPATFFVMPAFGDGVHRYMTPDDFRALRDAGMEIGSHTLNHATLPSLRRLNYGAFLSEIVNSKADLEDILEQPVDLLAYPNGAWDYATADELYRAGYRAAASTMPGGWQRPEEAYWLRRFRADPWEPPATVLARLRG